jgi:hypothetical protein
MIQPLRKSHRWTWLLLALLLPLLLALALLDRAPQSSPASTCTGGQP